jgi:hypothetical protein
MTEKDINFLSGHVHGGKKGLCWDEIILDVGECELFDNLQAVRMLN